jgi:hypothetical protein
LTGVEVREVVLPFIGPGVNPLFSPGPGLKINEAARWTKTGGQERKTNIMIDKSINDNEAKSKNGEIKRGDRLTMKVPFFQVPNWIFDDEHNLSTLDIAVYCYLARCGNQGAVAFPSLPTIARKCKMSRSSAAESINALGKHGFLKKTTIPGIGCEYEILYNSEPVQQADGTSPAGGRVTRPAGGPKKELSFKKEPLKEEKEGEQKNPAPTPGNPSANKKIKTEEPKAEVKDQDQGSELGQALGYYKEQFELRTDRQPVINNAEAAAMKKIINKYGLEDTKKCLQLLFNDQDPYYKKNGFPLLTFCSQINSFLTKLDGSGQGEPKAWGDIKDWLAEAGPEEQRDPAAGRGEIIDITPKPEADRKKEPVQEQQPVNWEENKARLQEARRRLEGVAS